MAKFDLNTYESVAKEGNSSKMERKVGYFKSLKDDGDTAIVRFAYHSPSEFDIVTVHKVQCDSEKYGKMWRSVSCLRGPYDPIDNCPLCKAGVKLYRKIYVKMLEYTKDENGNIIPKAVVWERPAEGKNDFVKKLMSIIGSGYSDLSKYVFIIRRNGAKGSLSTTYEINPANPDIYPSSIYVEDFKAFEGLSLSHHSYTERPYEDLVECAKTGVLPKFQSSSTTSSSSYTTNTANNSTPYAQPQSVPTQAVGVASHDVQTQNISYVGSSQQGQQVSTPSQNTQNPTEGVRPRRTNYVF